MLLRLIDSRQLLRRLVIFLNVNHDIINILHLRRSSIAQRIGLLGLAKIINLLIICLLKGGIGDSVVGLRVLHLVLSRQMFLRIRWHRIL